VAALLIATFAFSMLHKATAGENRQPAVQSLSYGKQRSVIKMQLKNKTALIAGVIGGLLRMVPLLPSGTGCL